jgi:hypothetical protein
MQKRAWVLCGSVVCFFGSIAVSKAQIDLAGPWGFLLKSPHTVPALLAIASILALIGLAEWQWARRFYWAVFSTIIPKAVPESQPPSAALPERLLIHSAKFGSGPLTDRDVHSELQLLCKNSSLDIVISYQLLIGPDPAKDDPDPGQRKRLLVEYSFAGGPVIKAERPNSTRLILPEDPWFLKMVSDLKSDSDALLECKKELQKQFYENGKQIEGLTYERDIARFNARADVLSTITPEAHYLIEQLEQIKDWNEKENPDNKVDLLYPLTGNQIGNDRTKWKWQQEYLIKWRTAYDRFLEYCKRLKVDTQLPALGSPTTYSKLVRSLENVERGDFRETSSSAEL